MDFFSIGCGHETEHIIDIGGVDWFTSSNRSRVGDLTTVSGSDGKILTGLHVEEERLPPFVHSHAGMYFHPTRVAPIFRQLDAGLQQGFPKGISWNYRIKNCTVKMETPVIYFYGDDKERYNVRVDFNGGTISQWYPQRTAGEKLPPLKVDPVKRTRTEIDFAKPFQGFIEWDVDVIPRGEIDEAVTFQPHQTPTWIYPKVPDANILKVGDQYEDYLFYRGVGNFEQAAEFRVTGRRTWRLKTRLRMPFPLLWPLKRMPMGFVSVFCRKEWVRKRRSGF